MNNEIICKRDRFNHLQQATVKLLVIDDIAATQISINWSNFFTGTTVYD